ncbi:hypothetical protein DC094_01650 [Pelagibaculum spongiae]|uniref:Uncharacterized protein n=1 Tax=Pelagibaculum spongiae TaxID=2080658 RepID=A0A2V1H3K0_9GAMM|nr:hypothetical protein DC094_01650 [Pelagibaculum spongiae]
MEFILAASTAYCSRQAFVCSQPLFFNSLTKLLQAQPITYRMSKSSSARQHAAAAAHGSCPPQGLSINV